MISIARQEKWDNKQQWIYLAMGDRHLGQTVPKEYILLGQDTLL